MCSACIQRWRLLIQFVLFWMLVIFRSLSCCYKLFLILLLAMVFYYRLSNISCLICQVLHSSRPMLFWYYSGQKYTIRLGLNFGSQFSLFALFGLVGLIIVSKWQARAVSTDGLRPSFYTINAVVYAIQVRLLVSL